MSKAEVTMEVGNDGVAVITMSNPPVNALALASTVYISEFLWNFDFGSLILCGQTLELVVWFWCSYRGVEGEIR